MQKVIIITITFMLGIIVIPANGQDGMEVIQSQHSVEETTDRLKNILKENGITIFQKVNHKEGAAAVNMDLSPTTVLIFGNPKLGTPLMQCAQTTAIDLPQKALVWEDSEGITHIGYNSPEYLKKRHNIEGCDQELNKISKALDKFTRAAAGSN
ncbi:DUF302 domain-containing protein [Fodinibius sp.]|uniref:DUF302 domain-containing protein n=1 Tax=Fodinibius sp. TaxID=1872440 RepID=UPI002ACE6F90|nr:DUF302 domain-containing protein [Fodinibius sp.]MDZ7659009.1 DUF302 domain-containing protein [Fodinibius sp.]